MKKLIFLAIAAMTVCTAKAQTEQATPSRDAIVSVARRVNDYFMRQWPDPKKPTFVRKSRPSSLWTRGVYYEGLMALQEIDPQQRYLDYTDEWANHHRWTPRNGTKTTDADDQCCCQTYLDRMEQTNMVGTNLIDSVRTNLEKQMASGRVNYWTWIDAIQMAMPLYSKMYRLTGDARYILYARDSYEWSRNTCGGGLWNSKEGLWWRDKDFVPPYKESDGNNCYWSRGNGWVVEALIKTIDDIDNSKAKLSGKDKKAVKAFRKELQKDYLAMMEALMKCQRSDGFWNVSLMSPVTFGGKETSGTALFVAGMAWGIRHNLLPAKKYLPVINKAWNAMVSDAVHDNGFLGYLQGTGKQPSDSQPVTYTSIPDFEDYGTGCFLLCANEMYKIAQ